MRKKFTTYLEEEHVNWLKQEALKQEIATGSRVSAADILNRLIEKEKAMNLTHKDLYFAHAATNNDLAHSDLELESAGVKYLIRDVPAPEGWDGESDWTDDDDYIDQVAHQMTAEIKE